MDRKLSLDRNQRQGGGRGKTIAPAETGMRPGIVLTVLGAGTVMVVVIFLLRSPRPSSEAFAPNAGRSSEVTATHETGVEKNQESGISTQSPATTAATVEDRWGIKIIGMRIAMGGNGLDLRYQVIDPVKAASLLHMEGLTFVIDENTGRALPIPFQRESQTSQKLVAGKTYFALLSNKGQVIKSGSKVTVAIGNIRERNVGVE